MKQNTTEGTSIIVKVHDAASSNAVKPGRNLTYLAEMSANVLSRVFFGGMLEDLIRLAVLDQIP